MNVHQCWKRNEVWDYLKHNTFNPSFKLTFFFFFSRCSTPSPPMSAESLFFFPPPLFWRFTCDLQKPQPNDLCHCSVSVAASSSLILWQSAAPPAGLLIMHNCYISTVATRHLKCYIPNSSMKKKIEENFSLMWRRSYYYYLFICRFYYTSGN